MPGQQFIKPMRGMGGDAREDVGEPGLRINAIHFRRDNETVHGCSAMPAAIGPAEQPRLSSQRNLAVILPISGRMSPSIIAGIHCTGGACVVFRARGAHQVMSCTWSCRPAP
jgi:hypothetical protein